MLTRECSKLPRDQAGVMLLEALIAILIFSLGILSLVALQATAIQLTGDAKYRTDATLLANRLIGQMWVGGSDLTTLETSFESAGPGPAYTAWLTDVAGTDGLPGVVAASTGVVSTLPVVTVVLGPNVCGNPPTTPRAAQVTIQLFWRTPEMSLNLRHQYTVVSEITRNCPP
jgi:type IV pilus assembly protein PilV